MNLSTLEILKAVGGRIVQGSESRSWECVSTDSRNMVPGALFFALKGPRFDGHDFVVQAARNGAQGAVVERAHFLRKQGADLPSGFTLMEVENSLRALGETAGAWRSKVEPLVAGITGSGGKTTTKEMVAEILSLCSPVLKNEGNLNNLIGLPLTLCRLDPEHSAAVLEMGMNTPGEIDKLCRIARPNVGLITNISHAHVGKLGSLEGVAKAKGEMLSHLSRGGTLVKNLDDPWVVRISRNHSGRTVTYSAEGPAHISLTKVEEKGSEGAVVEMLVRGEPVSIRLQALGRHNVMNALSAAAVGAALLLNCDQIRRGLENFRPVEGRMKLYTLGGGIHLIDDSYNANPQAMESALRTVSRLSKSNGGRFIAVLGDMKELGEYSETAHASLGRCLAECGVDQALYMGRMHESVIQGAQERGFEIKRIRIFEDHESMTLALKRQAKKNDWVLIKASREGGLDQVVKSMMDDQAR